MSPIELFRPATRVGDVRCSVALALLVPGVLIVTNELAPSVVLAMLILLSLVTVTAADAPSWVAICVAMDCTVVGASFWPAWAVVFAFRAKNVRPLLAAVAEPWLVPALRPRTQIGRAHV